MENEGYFTEIKTSKEFMGYTMRSDGYIVITDKHTDNYIHEPFCSFIKLENFEKKVIQNNCETGNYYWIDDKRFAMKRWKVKKCARCL